MSDREDSRQKCRFPGTLTSIARSCWLLATSQLPLSSSKLLGELTDTKFLLEASLVGNASATAEIAENYIRGGNYDTLEKSNYKLLMSESY